MAAPSPAELDDLSLACQRVWDLDANRLTPGVDYVINLQQPKRAFNQTDVADQNLFTFVNPTVLQRTNYRLYCALLDNYTKITGTAEQGTAVEMKETSDFLDFVIASQPMTYVHKYLVAKQLASPNVAEFKKQLHQMWFSLYSREVRDDSCGFEHVFVGEVDQGKVSGFHNWLQFHLQEARGLSNYGGYLLPRGARGVQEPVDEAERLISIQFGWGAESKDVSSIWIGTSPEFELALYSLCFLAGQEENLVQIAGYQVKIRCYRIRSKYGDKVGSTFPELLSKIPGARIEAVGAGWGFIPAAPGMLGL
ncbi:hypothetical protein WJX72_006687 [[Myrmecia] bisecta]|uniref:EndoU domain-containing protein n=1 Tax=[Myrmecia] bisecta TaxID=41462 RepID=A0AAW1QRY3_9CHLO